MQNPFDISVASDRALLMSFGEGVKVAPWFRLLRARSKDWGIASVQPGSASLLLKIEPSARSFEKLAARLAEIEIDASEIVSPAREHVIPVCYAPEFAPDLAWLAERAGMSIDQAINTHTSASYEVAFLGFMPGFAYLDGLPAALHAPRLETARVSVPKGSVAIGGAHTGIYPAASPGGWRLIGRTPLRLFSTSDQPSNRLGFGDQVRMEPISLAQYCNLGGE
jgi:KipI family sensor histidine kinase inhibitor